MKNTALKDGIVQGLTQGIILMVLLVGATFLFGNQQQVAVNYAKAQACELAVPITSEGRDPGLVAKCFTDVGLQAPHFVTP